MTVGQLLGACNSAELTLWQAFLKADAEWQEEHRDAERFRRSIEG